MVGAQLPLARLKSAAAYLGEGPRDNRHHRARPGDPRPSPDL